MSRYRRLLTDALTFHTINKDIVTMTENLTFRDDGFHEKLLFLDPNGFDRTVVPLGSFTVGYTVVIFNTASIGEIVFDPNVLAYTIRESDTYGPGVFTYTTTGWECRSPKTVYMSTTENPTLAELEGTLDDIADGTTYGRVILAGLSEGAVLLSAALGDLDDISDGSTYSRVLTTSISAGKILLTEAEGDLDDISDGTTYAKVAATSISAGKILLSQAEGTLDDLTDGTTYSRVYTADLSAGHIVTGVTGTGDLATADSVDWQTQVDGWGKPADNATVGATWGTNLLSIPTRFGNSASAAGLYLTSGYMGYWNGSSWNAYIRNNGYFYFGNGSTRYIYWNGSTLTISTPDEITCQQGCDIRMIGNDSNYARIRWDGTYDTYAWCNTYGHFYLDTGANGYWRGTSIVEIYGSTVYIRGGGSSGRAVLFSNTQVVPSLNNVLDLGSTYYAWKDFYYYTLHDVGDYFILDDRDDLADLMKLKPLIKNNEFVYDPESNLPLIDDSTWPDYVLTKHKRDIEPEYELEEHYKKTDTIKYPGHKKGEFATTPDGKPFINGTVWKSWMMGCIKQLNIKIEELTEEVRTLREEGEKKWNS